MNAAQLRALRGEHRRLRDENLQLRALIAHYREDLLAQQNQFALAIETVEILISEIQKVATSVRPVIDELRRHQDE